MNFLINFSGEGITFCASILLVPQHDVSFQLRLQHQAIRLTDKFYKKKGFPKGYRSFEQPEPARVFRYTKYEMVKAKLGEKKNRKKR